MLGERVTLFRRAKCRRPSIRSPSLQVPSPRGAVSALSLPRGVGARGGGACERCRQHGRQSQPPASNLQNPLGLHGRPRARASASSRGAGADCAVGSG